MRNGIAPSMSIECVWVSECRDRTNRSMTHLHLSVALIFIVIAVGVGRCRCCRFSRALQFFELIHFIEVHSGAAHTLKLIK